MESVLTHFVKTSSASANTDFAEQAANFCLTPFRLAFGRWVNVISSADNETGYDLNTDRNLCNIAVIDYIGRLFIAMFALSLALPLTLAGVIFALCSTSHQETIRGFIASRSSLPPDNPPAPSPPNSPSHQEKLRKMLQDGLEEDPTPEELERYKKTLRRAQQATLKRSQAVNLPPLPADFEATLDTLLSGNWMERLWKNDPEMVAKIQGDRIVDHLIELTKTANVQTLRKYVTAFECITPDHMLDLLTALCLNPQGMQIAVMDTPTIPPLPIRILFQVHIQDVVASDSSHPNRIHASLFLAACDPAWVAATFSSNGWIACAEGYSANNQLEPLKNLVIAIKNRGDAYLNFLQSLLSAQRIYLLQQQNEQELPLLWQEDFLTQPALSPLLNACSIKEIRAAFSNQAYRGKFLQTEYMQEEEQADLRAKFQQAFP